MLNAAIGGSTNAIVHLLAIAGRLGIELKLEDFQRCGRDVPLLVNLMPSGQFLMEDFCYAGGVPVLKEIASLLHTDAKTVFGTLQAAIDDAECFNRDVIKTLEAPVQDKAGITVLKGNLALEVPSLSLLLPHLNYWYIEDKPSYLKALKITKHG